ncbi:hypothetical protein LEP1GSC038_3844 [Leptospira weilii str. 2006001855]|uniref:Uncharacterized protein n=1 Tax=Leptospira weilii str. 2006001855 TaxID=996804 RepID=M6FZU0_9LEPT|nr:hypothetical protein LEP1GSC038_3844 [Leptospira weilii str. 2006001855]
MEPQESTKKRSETYSQLRESSKKKIASTNSVLSGAPYYDFSWMEYYRLKLSEKKNILSWLRLYLPLSISSYMRSCNV